MDEFFKNYCLPIILGCIPLGVNYWIMKSREEQQVKIQLKYLAVRLSVYLEEVLLGVMESFRAWSSYLAVGGDSPPVEFVNLFDGYPEDVNWHVLDVDIMDELLCFENYLKVIGGTIALERKISGNEQRVALVRLKMLKNAAEKAWSLVQMLRFLVGQKSPHHEYYEKSLMDMGRQLLQHEQWIKDEELHQAEVI